MSLLQGYYDAIDQEKAASTANAYATMRLTNQQAGQVAANAEADRALKAAQAVQLGQQAQLTGAQTAQVAPNAAASRDLDSSRAAMNQASTDAIPRTTAADVALKTAQAGLFGQQFKIGSYNTPGSNTGIFNPGGLPSLSTAGGFVPTGPIGVPLAQTGMPDPDKIQGFAKGGKVKVQGKGKPGPTDTVPTMLTPGEAVLNKGAVDHYGSKAIDAMNKMGLLRMGAQTEVATKLGLPDPHKLPAGGKSGTGGGKGGGGGGKAASGQRRGAGAAGSLPRLARAS